jgi:heme A synthase
MKTAQRLAFGTCIATVALIALGAAVRATASGLGCPDWPLCHGGVVPPGSQEPIIEYSHRVVASAVGLMVIATAVLAWRHYRHVPFTAWTATAGIPLVVFQGILGAVTVKQELPPEIVATHLVTAMLVLTCELAVAVSMYLEDPARAKLSSRRVQDRLRPLGALTLVATAWLGGLMWVGGYMAESGASTACAAWPTCNGLDAIPRADHQEITHMIHRYLAGGFAFVLLPLLVMLWRRRADLPWATALAVAGALLYVAQVAVGALNVWYVFPDPLTVSHTAIASGVWFVLSTLALVTYYRPAAERIVTVGTRAGVPA